MVSDQTYLQWQEKLKTDKWFRRFWVFCGIYIVGVFYIGFGLFFLHRWRAMTLLALLAFLLAKLVICNLISLFYKRIRPYQKLNFIPASSTIFLSRLRLRVHNSMPSSHAASLVAISTVCLVYCPPLGICGFIATVINNIARVILGYHYLSDILAGWVVGLFSAISVIYFLAPYVFTH